MFLTQERIESEAINNSFDAFVRVQDACLLCDLFCRHPVQLGAAGTVRCANSPGPSVVHLSFAFFKSKTAWTFCAQT